MAKDKETDKTPLETAKTSDQPLPQAPEPTQRVPAPSKAKYRFVCVGNMTVTIRGSRQRWKVDPTGQPLYTERLKALQIVFINGYGDTNDEIVAQGLQDHTQWVNEFYWHPSMASEVKGFDLEAAKRLMGTAQETTKAKIEARQRRLQRGPVLD